MGDFFVVKVMSGGQSASVARDVERDLRCCNIRAAAANAVVLLIIVLLMVAAILRLVDVRKELAR